jgi:hypothetical protein
VDLERLKEEIEVESIRIGNFKPGRVSRLVVHKDIDGAAAERLLDVLPRALEAARGGKAWRRSS